MYLHNHNANVQESYFWDIILKCSHSYFQITQQSHENASTEFLMTIGADIRPMEEFFLS